MSKATLIQQWRELGEGFVSSAPPKTSRYEAFLLINVCEVHKRKDKIVLERRADVVELYADSQHDLDQKVADFAETPGVRRLVKNVQPNELPRSVKNVAQDILDGTADFYQTVAVSA